MVTTQGESAFRYLLGHLSEAEAVEFEKQYFVDDSLFEEMSVLENDLVDSFVKGELSEIERQEFEKSYLISPARRANVEFSEALANYLYASGPHKTSGRALSILSSFQTWSGRLAWATLAAVIVGMSWLAVIKWRPHNEIDSIQPVEYQHQEQTLSRTTTGHDVPQPGHGINQQNILQSNTITLSLLPWLNRSPAATHKLVIRPAVSLVRLQLYLEHDHYVTYRVCVRDSEGRTVWEKRGLKSGMGPRAARILIFEVTSSILTNGNYSIKLEGLAANDSFIEIGNYAFQVAKH